MGFLGGMMPGMGGSASQSGGGPLGHMGLDLSPHKIPIVGNFFQNPAEIHKQQQFSQAGRAYNAYRPEMQQARMNVLQNGLHQYQGANNVLGAMMGGGAQPNSRLGMNPMGPSMMQVGMTSGGAGGPPKSQGLFGAYGPSAMLGGLGPLGLANPMRPF